MATTPTPRWLSVLFYAAHASIALCQGEPLTINTQVNPPYSAQLVDYFSSASQILININNTSSETRYIYLAGSISTLDNGVSAVVEGGTPWNAPALMIAPGMNHFTGADLQPFVQNGQGSVQLTGITEEQLVAGLLPEGDYHVCLRAYDYADNTVLSAAEPLGCSNVFTVQYPEPPVPISPSCGELVTPNVPQFIVFNWQLPAGPPLGMQVQYEFRLVRIWDAINAQSALETSTDVVYESTVTQAMIVYNQICPALIAGQMYAWWVHATDPLGEVLFGNNGYMQPCVFTYQAHDGAGFELVYPYPGDTLPWVHMPVIVRFDPHPLPLVTGRFHSMLRISENGGPPTFTERKPGDEDILWNSGPFESQDYILSHSGITPTPHLTEEMAHQINIFHNDAPYTGSFKRGSSYTIDADIRTNTYDETNVRYGDVAGNFVSGMGVPRLRSPLDNAVIPRVDANGNAATSVQVPLRFKTSEPPTRLLPPFPIWIIPENGPPTQTSANVQEAWELRVFRDYDLHDMVFSQEGSLPTNILLIPTAACDEACIRDAFYKEVEVIFQAQDTGTYYWEVRWMHEIDNGTTAPYHVSELRQFRITGPANSAAQNDNEPTRPAECLAVCRRTPTPMGERMPVITTAIGDTVQVGLFKMQVTSIAHSTGKATGEGLIDVPVMKAKLRVQFSNVEINAQKRLYDGTVQGQYDNSGVIPAGWTVGGSMAAGFNPAAAQQIDDYLNTAGRLVSQFAGSTPMGLPIGIDKELPDGRVVIGILGMQFTDTIARLNAGMGLPIHGVGTTVGLGNMAVPFHPGGIGDVSEEATLYLLGDISTRIGGDTLRMKGARFENGFMALEDSGTFVAWDCRGFRALTIDAEWRFSKDNLREDLPDGSDGPNKVTASLKMRTGRAGLMGRVDFNVPFHIDGTPGWGFDVQEAWLDLASYMNPPDMQLPDSVAVRVGSSTANGADQPAWEGFYMKRAMLRLPHEIERFGSNERTAVAVDNMVIDATGITGSLKVANVIGADAGSLDGWGFSIDTLQLDVVENSFEQAGFIGRVHLPIADTLLKYSSMIVEDPANDDKYMEFLLHPEGNYKMDCWLADLTLQPTSYLRAVLGRQDTTAFAKVLLNGELSITANTAGLGNINFRDIAFQGLTFQTRDPWTNADDSGVFSLASPQKYLGGAAPEEEDAPTSGGSAGAFPISITRVSVDRRNLDGTPMAGVGFDINLNLSGAVNIFTATTRIAVLGTLNTSALHHWGHHSVELDSIGVSGETGAVKIQGGLRWYNGDATYGDGINGSAHAWFMKGALEVAAAVQFGNKNGMRYWFADAMIAKDAGFSPGSPFNVYGFGGGAWYHMKRTSELPSAAQINTADIASQDDDHYTPGLTLSRVVFMPDAATEFGFQATIIFGDGAGGKAYNGDLTAGMQFSASGGVSQAFLDGDVYLLSSRNDRSYTPVWGKAHIGFDFPNDVFSANFKMYVSIGSGMVTGTGPNDLAGEVSLLVAPDDWHFFVGTPQTPVGLDFVGLFNSGFYFMVGKNLPPAEPPRSEILALVPADFFHRETMDDARALAFGTRTSMGDTLSLYLLRLRYAAELGFDLAFRDAGDMQCAGVGDPGIWGWYANGQVFAYLSGGVSLYVDLWFTSGEFDIMSIAAAAMMQGGFANPSYVKGAVSGSYSILGGAVDGNFYFPFTAGSECRDESTGLLGGLDPIGDLVPHQGTLAVDVGVEPEAIMNIKLNTAFTINELQPSGTRKLRTFRLKVDKFELRKQPSNSAVPSVFVTDATKDRVAMGPEDYLRPTTQYTVEYIVGAEERLATGWEILKKPGTQLPLTWRKQHTFTTGAGITELRAEDLDYSWPLDRQRYLLQDECRSGIVQCKSRMADQPVFTVPNGRIRKFRVAFTPRSAGSTVFVPATVEHSDKSRILFTLPQLLNNTIYTLQVVARDSMDISQLSMSAGSPSPSGAGAPGVMNNAIDMGTMAMAAGGVSTTTSHFGGLAMVHTNALNTYHLRSDEKLVYEYHFRTSAYNTITAKATGMNNVGTDHVIYELSVPRETVKPKFGGEGFDVYDIQGSHYGLVGQNTVGPLVHFEDAGTDLWRNSWAKPVLYDYYDLIRSTLCSNKQLERSVIVAQNPFGVDVTSILDHPDSIGIPPRFTVKPTSDCPIKTLLTASETEPFDPSNLATALPGSNTAPTYSSKFETVTPTWVRKDFLRLQTITPDVIAHCGPQLTEQYWPQAMTDKLAAFRATTFKKLYNATYKLKLSFVPPPICTPFTDWNSTATAGSTGLASYGLPTGTNPPNPNVSGATGIGIMGTQP